MMPIIELGFYLITWTTCAPGVLALEIFCQGIAALNHEPFNDSMKASAIIKTRLSEGFKILHRLWSHIRPKLHHHFADTCANHCDFVIHNFSFFRILWFVTRQVPVPRRSR